MSGGRISRVAGWRVAVMAGPRAGRVGTILKAHGRSWVVRFDDGTEGHVLRRVLRVLDKPPVETLAPDAKRPRAAVHRVGKQLRDNPQAECVAVLRTPTNRVYVLPWRGQRLRGLVGVYDRSVSQQELMEDLAYGS